MGFPKIFSQTLAKPVIGGDFVTKLK